MKHKYTRRKLLLVGTMLAGVPAGRAAAEPVDNRYLAETKLEARGNCSILTIRFNFRTRYLSHFPSNEGKSLRINVRPIDNGPDVKEALFSFSRESLRPVHDQNVSIAAIEFEADTAGGQVLSLQFPQVIHYAVSQGNDFTSLRITLSPTGADAACLARLPITAAELPAGEVTPAKKKQVAADLRKAQQAMAAKRDDEAIALLTRILQAPENEFSPTALELLGLAREHKGQLAHAKAEYEEFLRRYPGGEAAPRVRQRLAGLVTAAQQPQEKLRKTKDLSADAGMTASVSGSLSTYYFRNDRYFGSTEPFAFRFNDYEQGQSELLSSADITAEAGNHDFRSKLRFSGSHVKNLLQGEDDDFRLSSLYYDTSIDPWGVKGRIGRQSRNAAGVLGRFDGGYLGWQYSPQLSFNAVAGSPVTSTRDLTIDDERFFYGASVDVNPGSDALNGSLYYIEQQGLSHSIERRAIGSELRYTDDFNTAFAAAEYDIEFGELNSALITASHMFADKSVVNASADYRRAFVLKSMDQYTGDITAFQQLVDTLKGDDGYLYYFDRTAISTSASLGYSRPLGDHFQVNLNATVTNFKPGSYDEVEANVDTGNEYFYSAQLIGNGLISDGDIYTLGLRYADTLTYDAYTVDINAKYPLSANLRVSPKMRFRYRVWDEGDLTEYALLPSVGLEYAYLRDHHFEVELGSEWVNREQATGWDSSLDLFLVAGYRLDF